MQLLAGDQELTGKLGSIGLRAVYRPDCLELYPSEMMQKFTQVRHDAAYRSIIPTSDLIFPPD